MTNNNSKRVPDANRNHSVPSNGAVLFASCAAVFYTLITRYFMYIIYNILMAPIFSIYTTSRKKIYFYNEENARNVTK